MSDRSGAAQFDPLQLTEEASLNRTVLAELLGADQSAVGRRAFDVLSLAALEDLARDAGIDGKEPATRRLCAGLESDDVARVTAARAVISTFGRRLAHLIATLRSGPGTSVPRGSWRAAYLGHWAGVQQVWLGGGLVAGLGEPLVLAARAEMRRLGPPACEIYGAPHADVLALVGAARSRAPRESSRTGKSINQALVLDFGHTAVKRAIARSSAVALVTLEVLPSLSAPATERSDAVAQHLLDTISSSLVEARRAAGPIDPRIVASIASYVVDGHPASSRGQYGLLRHVPHAELEGDLRQRTGEAISLRLMHDGTAAASGLVSPRGQHGVAGQRAALIQLGTSLAVGFPASPDAGTPVARGFAVTRV